jgi:hypothetical protein
VSLFVLSPEIEDRDEVECATFISKKIFFFKISKINLQKQLSISYKKKIIDSNFLTIKAKGPENAHN